ncbi:YqjF family protein [Hyalangium versicolor]|uniref:YqjF family protein n=1 Tax=Hyalangium versicolor TaxID=2861190 RepID=UPI001CCD9772|nr:DUF2071 domain-containing protein [Hyalangium versicolor]
MAKGDTIDRIAPTLRPNGQPVMYQRWRTLLFLHWEFPAEVVAPLVPPGLTLDTYEDRVLVGLVPFTMKGVRPAGLPAFSPLSNFHETNVRTYVHREGQEPGVWFFSLDAANRIAVKLARAWFKLPYHFARMRLEYEGAWISYSSERLWPTPVPARCAVRCSPKGEAAVSKPGTLQHFLVERYYLYTLHGGSLWRGQVHHTPYPVRGVEVQGLDESLLAAAGLTRPQVPPLVHFSEGVDVDVFGLTRL